MAGKAIKISAADDSNYKTLPGSNGSINRSAGKLNDTVFGQTWQSQQPGAKTWNMAANAFYKGFPGYVAKLKKSGVATTMTDEAMSLVSGKTYKITASSKQCIDRLTAITVKDNAVTVDPADILNFDYLFGRVTFKSSYTPTTPITITGKYLPLSSFGWGNSIKLTMQCNAIDESTFDLLQGNGGYMSYQPGLRTVNFSVEGIQSSANGLPAILEAGTEYVLELSPDGSNKSTARAIVKLTEDNQSGEVGALEQESTTWDLFVPSDDLMLAPFNWIEDSSSTLPTALATVITSYLNQTKIYAQYLEDGTTGEKGQVIVTECSLQTGVGAMNEFSVSLQGCGALTAVP